QREGRESPGLRAPVTVDPVGNCPREHPVRETHGSRELARDRLTVPSALEC
ncbi:unnamed protein product, partial [Ascophyllum nodosum]